MEFMSSPLEDLLAEELDTRRFGITARGEAAYRVDRRGRIERRLESCWAGAGLDPASGDARRRRAADAVERFVDACFQGDLVVGYQAMGLLAPLGTQLFGSAFQLVLWRDTYPLQRALLVGETGTGKEGLSRIAAAALLALSAPRGRRDPAPSLRSINCAAVPEALLEAEIFGAARGAATGIDRERKGLIEDAGDGGVVFLDEIGEASPKLQAALLRFLQDGGFQRLGDPTPREARVHVIAATNRPSDGRSNRGLRPDLMFRLARPELPVPPLRTMVSQEKTFRTIVESRLGFLTSDLPDHLVDMLQLPVIGRLVVRATRGHDWPGNFRELDALLRAVLAGAITAEGTASAEAIQAVCQQHLRRLGGASDRPGTAGLSPARDPVAWPVDLSALRAAFEESWYRRAAGEHTTKEQVARALGLSRQTVYRRLRHFGIELASEGS